jgi:hypothetical protein
MRRLSILVSASVAVIVIGSAPAGCSATDSSSFDDDGGNSGTGASGTGGNGGSIFEGGMNMGGSGNAPVCNDPDCIGNTPQGNCDTGLAIDSADAMDGARAMGLCQVAQPGTWGVVNAEWVRSDGQPLSGVLARGKGILDHFGNAMVPREGATMLALSSGSARNPGEPEYYDPQGDWKDQMIHGAPPGYPKESPSCPGVETGDPYDSAGLRLTIRTPRDAKSFTFDFDFYTYEYPDYICSMFNDFFVAMLSPPLATLPDGNISFDEQGNTISVNAGFLAACQPCNAGGKQFDCPLGYGEILGTGFDSNMGFTCMIQGSAATSWLVTTAPIEVPGTEVTLLFAIWDSGDGILDSTVLIDNFKFELTEGEVGTVPVPR